MKRNQDYDKYSYSAREILKYGVQGVLLCVAVDYLFYKSFWVLLPMLPFPILFLKWKKKQLIQERKRKLDYQFKDMGYPNIFVGTVEGYPELENVKKLLKKTGLKKIALAPFMIVAGDHATNDLAGDEEDSWKSLLEAEGYEVRCILKGLGEYPQVRSLLAEHIAAVQ